MNWALHDKLQKTKLGGKVLSYRNKRLYKKKSKITKRSNIAKKSRTINYIK